MGNSASQRALQQLFGDEVPTRADPERAASAALRRSAELLAQEFDALRQMRLIEGVLADEIRVSGDRIRCEMPDDRREPEPLLRVVMQGRTTAGKSTLLEALSHGDGLRRGAGAQRTSLDVEERAVKEIPGVVLVDVPGVGAADAADDQEVAFAQLNRADVILWVATNEAPKNNTIDALRRIAMLGKPVIVAVNCRQRLDLAPHRDRFLESPDAVFAQAGTLAGIVERHLLSEGNSSIVSIAVHADAAFRAISDEVKGEALRRSSRIDALLSALRVELATAPQRRFIRKVDAVRARAVDELARLNAALSVCGGEIERCAGMYSARSARLERVLQAHEEMVRAEIRVGIERRRHWYSTVNLEKDVEELWHSELRELHEELSRTLEERGAQLAHDLSEEEKRIRADWAPETFESQLKTKPLPLAGMGSVWANWGVKALVIGAGIALSIPTAGLSMGWSLLIMVGSTAFATQSKRLLRFVDRKLPNAAERARRRREEVARRTGEDLEELLAIAVDAIAEHKAQVEALVQTSLEADADHIRALRQLRAGLSGVAGRVIYGLSSFDQVTAQGVLRIVGRRRAADGIVRSSRSPGLAILVEVDDRSYNELALFPPSTVEAIAPTRGGETVSAVGQAILAAPGLGLMYGSASGDSVVLVHQESARSAQLERMGELLTRFTGTSVSVVGQTHEEHCENTR